MSEISSGALVRLAMWAKNMTAIRDGRMEWPGFSHSNDECQRQRTLSETVTTAAFGNIWRGQSVAIPCLET